MNEPAKPPAVLDLRTSRRSLAYEALLGLSRELLLARFALTRALDKLSTEEVLDVLDEVGSTADRQRRRDPE